MYRIDTKSMWGGYGVKFFNGTPEELQDLEITLMNNGIKIIGIENITDHDTI